MMDRRLGSTIIGDSPPRLADGRDSGFRISDFEPG